MNKMRESWPWSSVLLVILGVVIAMQVCQALGLPWSPSLLAFGWLCLTLAFFSPSVLGLGEVPWGRMTLVLGAGLTAAYFGGWEGAPLLGAGVAICAILAVVTRIEYWRPEK